VAKLEVIFDSQDILSRKDLRIERLLHHDSAAGTRLAGECWIDRLHSLPSIRSFERKDGQKRAPPCSTNALGKGVVADDIGNPQVFMVDHIVRLQQVARFLVMEVAAPPDDVLARFGEQRDGFASSVTALLATGDAALAVSQVGFRFAIVRWGEDARCIGSHAE
jgi:hypothetical protein